MKHYMPSKLPVKGLDWHRIAPLLGPAHAALSKFEALVQEVPESSLFISSMTSSESLASSRIEGTDALLSDVLEHEFVEDTRHASSYVRENVQDVLNYKAALNEARRLIKEDNLPLTGRVIRKAHAVLMRSPKDQPFNPGNFRNVDVKVGTPTSYVPPRHQLVADLFANLEKYINSDAEDPLVQLAIIHAQFEMIHPFRDGNGRVGRMLLPLFLYYKGILKEPYFYLSAFFERDRDGYYNGLAAISRKGNWNGWISYFLRAVAEQSGKNAQCAQNILDMRKVLLKQVQDATHTTHSPQIVEFILSNTVFSSRKFKREAGVPEPSAYRICGILVSNDIIQVKSQGRGRRATIYQSDRLIELLEQI